MEHDPSYDIMLGYVCNVECRFCSQELDWRKDDWLPLASARERIFAAYQRGCRLLNILGGEATIYPDILPLVTFARKVGYRTIQFETNGLRLADPAFAERLVRAGLTRVSFSIHASSAALHDKLVQKEGAFVRLCAAIELMRPLGVAVRVALVVNRLNCGDLEEYCRYFLQEMKVLEFQFIYPLYTGDFISHREEMAVPLKAAAEAIEKAFRFLERSDSRTRAIAHNVPPCLLPSRFDRIGDWQDVGMEVLKPDGREYRDTARLPLYGKVFVDACARCSMRGSCVGVDPAYLRHWGEGEFKPLSGDEVLCGESTL
jgi:MoaA/NifB/PqqE/SkfB family radical SAM enzyme